MYALARTVAYALAASMLLSVGESKAQSGTVTSPPVTYLAQGWTAADRDTFYTTGQGSHLMPFAWFSALPRLDVAQAFAADQLQRYGYLRNDNPNNSNGLPVGFVVEETSGQLGMTCAACHTGQFEYNKDGTNHILRIDGAPADADFQQFLVDLTAAAQATLAQSDRFNTFARAVLGSGYSTASAEQLKADFGAWVEQFGDFMQASLPTSPWGPGRLDAFGMIFNRVAGRDLGIHANFRIADAPVSYPFLWNAPRQDHTQWNGGVPNGLFIQGLARNTGEVFGVFAQFAPKLLVPGIGAIPTVISYRNNSADFAGLETLEEKIATLQPPQWPREIFGLDVAIAEKGKALFDIHCAQCHGQQNSPEVIGAWATPVRAVGTDPKTVDNAARTSNPGIYIGAPLPPPAIGAKFSDPAKTGDILAGTVIGSLLEEAFGLPITPTKLAQSGVWRAIRKDIPDVNLGDLLNPQLDILNDLKGLVKSRLSNMFIKPAAADAGAAYESRVLNGIWATAPYLHNGSVPNLWELMTPPKERAPNFPVGCRLFDPKNVGYSTDQPSCMTGTFVADPNNANGNGNGGHDFGTELSADERWSIIEYLKTL